jgi:hypothetical protein
MKRGRISVDLVSAARWLQGVQNDFFHQWQLGLYGVPNRLIVNSVDA